MRKLISAMKISLDGKISGPEGDADWVDGWSDDYGLMQQIDACVLGGGMYPDYEKYWTRIQQEPEKILPESNKKPTAGEVKWARFAEHTPHFVLSNTVTSALWPNTSFLRGSKEISGLKQQPGKDIYLIGGGRIVASLIDAGLVDELRLIVYPLIAGDGKGLFATTKGRRQLDLRESRQLANGCISMVYDIS